MMKKFVRNKFGLTAMLLLLAVLAVGIVMSPVAGYAAKGNLVSMSEAYENIVELEFGKAKLLKLDGNVSDVLVADPEIVDVVAVQSDKLYLVGLNYGDTNLIILDDQGEVLEEFQIHIRLDLAVAEQYMRDNWPDEDVHLDMLSDQLILRGTVSTPEVASQIKRAIGFYYMEIIDEDGTVDEWVIDLMKVRGERQVMLRVRIVEVSRTILRELGTDTIAVTDFGGLLGDEVGLDFARSVSLFGDSGGLQEPGFGSLGVVSSVGAFGPVGIVFEALVDEGLANLLAEPNLTAISGQPSSFLAGGEFPVPMGRDSDGNVVISYRDFGVSLSFLPTVLSDERIILDLNTEVSSLNRTESVTLQGLEVPGLDIRRAQTTVEMASGQSLMIAGLIQSETTQALANLPGIEKTPVIGDLLKSESFQRAESELVVIVSPFLVKPYANKDYAKDMVQATDNAAKGLMAAFAKNIRRRYGDSGDAVLANVDNYGYILD